MVSRYPEQAVIDTQRSGLTFHLGLAVLLSKQRELESAEEKNKLASRLFALTLTEPSSACGCQLVRSLANPEDAASASLPGRRYSERAGLEVENLHHRHLSELDFVQEPTRSLHFIASPKSLTDDYGLTIFRFR